MGRPSSLALTGSQSRGGALQPSAEVGNAEPLGAQALHYALLFRFIAYDDDEDEERSEQVNECVNQSIN